MPIPLKLEILAQPDDTTCGPTCLHAVYRYYDDDLSLQQVIREAPTLDEGGTLAVLLGCHALRRQYRATIYTYNLEVFDPTWFGNPMARPGGRHNATALKNYLVRRLQAQMAAKDSPKLKAASQAYIDFLQCGGEICMQDLNAALLRRHLKRAVPILTGLSSTYLYQCQRETEPDGEPDDVRGVRTGHFVVLCGYGRKPRTVRVADPYLPNPLSEVHHYEVGLDRLICAILLGVLTYDANLLVIEPRRERQRKMITRGKEA